MQTLYANAKYQIFPSSVPVLIQLETGMVWNGMTWHGMVWYGMVWYGMVWYGMT